MDTARGAYIVAISIFSGFLLLSISTCSNKNDFESCFSKVHAAYHLVENDISRTLGSAELCSSIPR